jgi:3-oxoadipate enol-lactonase
MPHLQLPDGASLYYESHGPKPGTAPTIVFAHGAGGNHLSWWQQVPHFRDRYSCVVFDHRGWGISSKPADGARFSGDLRALLDHLGIERTAIVAQSMGGWTSLRFALELPARVERLVLCDTHGGISSPDIDGWTKATAENAAKSPAAKLPPGVHPAVGERMYSEQPVLASLYEQIDTLNRITRQEVFAAIQQAGTVTLEEAATIAFPVLLLYGEEDIVIPPPFLEAAAAAIPGARVVPIPKAGHSAYFERPGPFNAAVDEFLSG